MDKAGVESADRNLMRADNLVLRVETDDMKFFAIGIPGKSRKSRQAIVFRILTSTNSPYGLTIALRLGDATTQLDTGHNLAVGGSRDSRTDLLEFAGGSRRKILEVLTELGGDFFASADCRFARSS